MGFHVRIPVSCPFVTRIADLVCQKKQWRLSLSTFPLSPANSLRQSRIDFDYATDDEVLAAFRRLSRTEGIIPALKSSHAIAHVLKVAPILSSVQILIATLSGRADKDVAQVAELILK